MFINMEIHESIAAPISPALPTPPQRLQSASEYNFHMLNNIEIDETCNSRIFKHIEIA
jgi:hypothetical protein